MIEINRNRLVPFVEVMWGDIIGKISKQEDLIELFSSYATESWVSEQGFLSSIPSSYATKNWVEHQEYITSEALSGYATEAWVSEQSYLSSVPSEYATKSWVSGKGYAAKSWVEDNFLSEIPSTYATQAWVLGKSYASQSWVTSNFLSEVPSTFATKSWVESNGYLSSIPSDYATKSWVSGKDYATVSWVEDQGFIRHISSDYATKSWVEDQSYITSAALSGYATEEFVSSAISGFATESWVTSQGYLKSVPSSYATKSWVSSQGYLTEHQPLKTINNQSIVGTGNLEVTAEVPDYYATKSWVSEQGYATETWVTSQGYLSEVPAGYATESWVSAQGFLTSETIPADIATQSWVTSQGYITSDSLSGYATESWVTSQGYITSDALSGYATESWVSAQGYVTSEDLSSYAEKDDAELAPLYDKDASDNGYLKYKFLMAGKSAKYVPSGAASGTYGTRTVFNINDDIITFTYRSTTYGGNGMIYKFNFDTFTFDELIQGYNYPSSELPMWTDNTGRVYYGVTYTVNLNTGEFTSWDSGVSSDFKVYQSSLNNIVKFNGSIYLIPGDKTYAYKFNESTQQFEQTLTLSGVSDANWLRYKCYFNGKVIYYNGSTMYELKEIVESDVVTGLYFDEVLTPYFPVTFYNVETEENAAINAQQVFEITVNGVTEHVFWASAAGSHVYQLVDGVWVSIPGFTKPTASGTSSGAIHGDMLFGFGYGTADNLLIWNFNTTKEIYGWDNSVDSRLSAIESSLDTALTITNNILS